MKEAINKIEVLGAKDEPLCKNDRHRLRDVEPCSMGLPTLRRTASKL